MIKKVKLKNKDLNGSAKGKTYRFKQGENYLAPRDCTYPLSGPGKHLNGDTE